MVKIILLLLLAFCSSAESYAQTNRKDSLQTLLKKEKRDTSRVLLLVDLSFAYLSNKPDTAMRLALEALSLSKRIGFVEGETLSLSSIGNVYRVIGNLPKAMEVNLQALKLSEKSNNLAGIARDVHSIGFIYNTQGEYRQAIGYFLKAKKLNEQLNNKQGLAQNLGNLGRSYFELKKYDSARVYVQQAYEIVVNETSRNGHLLSLLGEIYSATGEKKLAMEYYRLSITHLKLREQNANLGNTYLYMAKLFADDGRKDSMLLYANQAFNISTSGGFTVGVLKASKFLYSYHKKEGNSDSAFFYVEIAMVANDSLNSREKFNQFQSLSIDEKLRQKELTEERKNNLQFAALAIGLITFIILYFALSRSIIVKTKFIEFFGILGLLAVFEFINLFIHPYLVRVTHHTPVLMLLILIAIGALLIPLHHKLEKWITKIMVEKNKKIRLEAAKKTIAELTVKQAN